MTALDDAQRVVRARRDAIYARRHAEITMHRLNAAMAQLAASVKASLGPFAGIAEVLRQPDGR